MSYFWLPLTSACSARSQLCRRCRLRPVLGSVPLVCSAMGLLHNRLLLSLFCLWRYRSSSRHCYPCQLCSSVTLNLLQLPPSAPPCRSDVSLSFKKSSEIFIRGGFWLQVFAFVCVCVQIWGTSRISEQTELGEAPNGNRLSSFSCRQTSLCETHAARRIPRGTDTTNEAKYSLQEIFQQLHQALN